MRSPLRVVTAAALAGAAALAAAASAATPAAAPSIHFVERGGGVRFIDNPPKARHPFDFSAGDLAIVSRSLYADSGRKGTLRLACVFTTRSADHCTGTATLPGGTLELAGVSSASPTTDVAVVGGTGTYAGARGEAIAKDRSRNSDVADLQITLLG